MREGYWWTYGMLTIIGKLFIMLFEWQFFLQLKHGKLFVLHCMHYTPFTRWSKRRGNVKQTSSNQSKRRARVFWIHFLDDCLMFAWSCKLGIMLHVNARNNDVLAEKIVNFVVVANNKMLFGSFSVIINRSQMCKILL